MPNHIIKPATILLICICGLFSSLPAAAQGWAAGSPAWVSVDVGIAGKNCLRAITYYRYSYADTYYEEHRRSTENGPVYNAGFNYAGASVAYGVTKRLTVEFGTGYFFDKSQNGHFPFDDSTVYFRNLGSGLSNGALIVKYGDWIKPLQQIELTSGFGLRFPFSAQPQMSDGVRLSRDVQTSSNAFGFSEMLFFSKGFQSVTLRLFSINRYDYNFADKTGYTYGNLLMNSIFVSKNITKYFSCIIQIRNEWKTNDKDASTLNKTGGNKVSDSGFDLVTVSPQLSYSIAGKWNLSLTGDIPVYKYYNGRQMTPKYSIALSLTREFSLGNKLPVVQPDKIK